MKRLVMILAAASVAAYGNTGTVSATLEGGAWDATLPALRRFQDDLYALSQALSLLSKVFHPEPGKDPPTAPARTAGSASNASARSRRRRTRGRTPRRPAGARR